MAHLVNAALLTGMFVFALATYDGLPERFPVHFNMAGQPDNFVSKSMGMWLLLPLTGLGLTVILYASAGLINYARKHPRWLSLPHKEQFLALPVKQQEPVWNQMRSMMFWLCVPSNLLVMYAQYSTYMFTTGESESFTAWPLLVIMAAMFIMIFVMTFNFIRGVKRAVGSDPKP